MARYQDVARDLRVRIYSGEYPVGATLPTYAELTHTYDVGRGVISAALALLEREGGSTRGQYATLHVSPKQTPARAATSTASRRPGTAHSAGRSTLALASPVARRPPSSTSAPRPPPSSFSSSEPPPRQDSR